MGLHHDKAAKERADRRFDRLIDIDRRLTEAHHRYASLSRIEAHLEDVRETFSVDIKAGAGAERLDHLHTSRERLSTQLHLARHAMRDLDQEIWALRCERNRLVRENQDDSWRAEGGQWQGKGEVIDLCEYRNRMRFRVRLSPPMARRNDAA